MRVLQGVFGMMAVLISIIQLIGGFALHLYTVYLFFGIYGIWLAVASFIMPIFSELFIAYKLTTVLGWNNTYLLVLVLYATTFVLGPLFTAVVLYATDKIEKRKLAVQE